MAEEFPRYPIKALEALRKRKCTLPEAVKAIGDRGERYSMEFLVDDLISVGYKKEEVLDFGEKVGKIKELLGSGEDASKLIADGYPIQYVNFVMGWLH
ncbi:MAG: hypothetical protein ABH854_05545 [Candidatus Diapherotrites archaeon]